MPKVPKFFHSSSIHEGVESMQNEKSARTDDPFLSSARWKKFRKMFIRKYPFCFIHEDEGLISKNGHVDHVIPRSQGGAELDERNCIYLCGSVHATKTNLEREGLIQLKTCGKWGSYYPAPGELEKLKKILNGKEDDSFNW